MAAWLERFALVSAQLRDLNVRFAALNVEWRRIAEAASKGAGE
jgi:hypothetical protein